MTAAISRAVMALAICCLGESRREWARGMRAEFDEAIAEGEAFPFATGCLLAAWREMPGHAEGRLVLATYALALGLLIPMAVLQFALALGYSSVFVGLDPFNGHLLPGISHNAMLASSQFSVLPCLLSLWLLLGVGHLRLAWVLVEQDWARVAKVSAFIGATLTTLVIFTGALVLDVTFVMLQAAAMGLEVAALVAVARRHAQLVPDAAQEMAAR